jgi:hypothetical protein
MAVFEWTAKVENVKIHASCSEVIYRCGFQIDEAGSTDKQIYAICKPKVTGGYWHGVRLIAAWKNERNRELSLEIRSDEPALRSGTHCEQRAKELMKLLPPI